MLAPIMVFNSQQQGAQKLANALEQLELGAVTAVEVASGSSGGGAGGWSGEGAGSLPHPPQQQEDMLAAA